MPKGLCTPCQNFARVKRSGIVLVALVISLCAAASAQDDYGKLVESRESLYNNIYIYRQGDFLSMTFGYNRAASMKNALTNRPFILVPFLTGLFSTGCRDV